MSFTFIPAGEVKRKSAVIIGLSGVSGSGKTYSALMLAQILAKAKGGPVLAADTENGRMADYKNAATFPQLHPFLWTEFEPPWSSARYTELVEAADKAGAGCLVIDSGTDEWDGPGGVLDLHEQTVSRLCGGNDSKREQMNFAGWAKAKPPHKKFANALFHAKANIILCFRAQKKIVVERAGGKTTIIDKGLQPICGTDLPYKLRFHLLMHEGGDGAYDVLRANQHERTVFPPGGRIDSQAGERLLAIVADVDAENAAIFEETITEHQTADMLALLVEVGEDESRLLGWASKAAGEPIEQVADLPAALWDRAIRQVEKLRGKP